MTPRSGSVLSTRWAENSPIAEELDAHGCAPTGPLLTPGECATVAALYDEPDRFRTTIDMARYRFGRGQYRYFDHPLPEIVNELRHLLYPRLLPVARDWADQLGKPTPRGPTRSTNGFRVPRRRAAAPDPDPAAVRARRLERAASRPVRRPGLPAPGRDRPQPTRSRLHRRRVPDDRAAAARAVPRPGPHPGQGHGLVFTTRDRPVALDRAAGHEPRCGTA